MKKITLSIPLIWVFLACVNNLGTDTSSGTMGGTNDETVVRTGAIIYEQDGITPSKGALVKVFRADEIDGKYVFLQTTDSEGRYFINDLEPGIFNIWVEKDSMLAFQDSVCISANSTALRNDTLNCASSLTGFTILQPMFDPHSVTIQVIGTDKCLNNIDSSGHFILRGMAGGTFSLYFKSKIPDYTPIIRKVDVQTCTNDTLKDTIRMIESSMGTMYKPLHASSNGIVHENFSNIVLHMHPVIYGNENDSLNRSRLYNVVLNDSFFTNIIIDRKRFP